MNDPKGFDPNRKPSPSAKPKWTASDQATSDSRDQSRASLAKPYFKQVYRRRPSKVQRLIRRARNILITASLIFLVISPFAFHPQWTFGQTVRHILSIPNCSFARMVGLEKAREGYPGYYGHHDRDGDGIACEPIPLNAVSP